MSTQVWTVIFAFAPEEVFIGGPGRIFKVVAERVLVILDRFDLF